VRPFFFGTSKQPLFGIYHPPAAKPARRTAVLLCNPLGQEAIRAHRIYRVMADRLSRSGFPVLRFDYFATGDSSGDCGEASLDRWVDDVLAAGEELADTAGVQRVAGIGLRLGANAVALASIRRPTALTDLVLWEPVVDGLAYLEELRQAHLAFLAEDLEFPPPHPFAAGTAQTIEVDGALGFAIPPALRQEIRALDVGKLAGMQAQRIGVVTSAMTEELGRLQRALGPAVSWKTVGPSEAWNSDQAMNSLVIPVDAMNVIIGCLEEAR
jgi:pimeloyl-ACP methyl ester carboxylesterase